MKAFAQGDLNGLCGLYSVVNAIHHLLQVSVPEQFSNDLFKEVAGSIPRGDYPDILWDGMDVDTLFRVSCKTAKHIERRYGFDINVSRPFKSRIFSKASSCLTELQDIWSETPSTFIIGIDWAGRSGGGHWTVVKTIEPNLLGLHDSGGLRSISRQSLALTSHTKNRLTPQDTILFQLIAINGKVLDR